MGLSLKPRLMKVFGLVGVLLAPPSIRAALTIGNSMPDASTTPKQVSRVATGGGGEDAGIDTPPLTRPSSLESIQTGIPMIAMWDGNIEVYTLLPFPPTPPESIYDENESTMDDQEDETPSPWLPEIVAAITVAVNFLLAPFGGRVRRGGGCRRGNDADRDARDSRDDPRDHAPRWSLWKNFKDAAGRVIDRAGSGLRAVADRIFGGLFDDPDARAARLVALASAFQVRDMPRQSGGQEKRQDSGMLIEVDRVRLEAGKGVSAGVELVCRRACSMYPEVGYNQGFDAACKAIFLSVGKNAAAALAIFTKWAVPVAWLLFNEYVAGEYAAKPAVAYTWKIIETHAAPVFGWLSRDTIVGRHDEDQMLESIMEHVFFEPLTTFCSRLGFGKSVMNDIMEETMKAGVHGPAVSLYVVMCLLCVAERDGAERVDEITMVKVHMKAAASKTRSFKALQDQAPVTLVDFVAGYRGAMSHIPLAGVGDI